MQALVLEDFDKVYIGDVRVTAGVARYKPKTRIKRVGRYYTMEQVSENVVPNSLLFKTRRAAKKFFSKTIKVNSVPQMLALFGQPTTSYSPLLGHPASDKNFWLVTDTDMDSIKTKAKALGLSDSFFDV